MPVVVCGAAGSGKTLIGTLLGRALDWPFVDADALHSPEAVAAMRSGRALTDEERWPWLDRVAAAAAGDVVVACSALARRHRDRIRAGAPGAWCLQLLADVTVLEERMRGRTGHFMPASQAQSQQAALEPLGPGEAGLVVDATRPPDEVVQTALAALRRG